ESDSAWAFAPGASKQKRFFGVSSIETKYSIYVAHKYLTIMKERECIVQPSYLSAQGGPINADKITLTQQRLFAWLRRFEIKKDGTNTIALDPKSDTVFISDLANFSAQQSELLRAAGLGTGTEDA